MFTQVWVSIDSYNGLLPDDNKPLTEPLLNYKPPKLFRVIYLGSILKDEQMNVFRNAYSEITGLKLQP